MSEKLASQQEARNRKSAADLRCRRPNHRARCASQQEVGIYGSCMAWPCGLLQTTRCRGSDVGVLGLIWPQTPLW